MSRKILSDEEKFSVFSIDEAGKRTLDLPRIADIFRRAGSYCFREEKLAQIFNKYSDRLAKALFIHEHGGKADKDIKRALRNITMLARDHDIDTIVFPVSEDLNCGQHFRKNFLYGENFAKFYNMKAAFQDSDYESAPEIAKLGKPKEPPTNTAFDYGLFK